MFQALSQGATLYILRKNDMTMDAGRILSVNTHLPQFNPSQPQAMLAGMVTDITVSVGSETIPFAGLPASASVANFPEKGIFVSENQALVMNEVTAIRDNSQRIVDGYEPNKAMVARCDELLLSLNPEKQKEVQAAKEMTELRNEVAEMRRMLSVVLGAKTKEE